MCVVDDYVADEWAYIPHFYRDFYVYQYATSFTASAALSEACSPATPRRASAICDFSRPADRDYPIDAPEGSRRGHDDAGAARATMPEMNRVMDEME